jgi:hypothetical protein
VQIVTVLASALGPVLLHEANHVAGSYVPFLHVAVPRAAALGVMAWRVRLPRPDQGA